MSRELGALSFLEAELAELDAHNLLRRPRIAEAGLIVLCSNDYLGLAAEPLVVPNGRGGSGASALIAGYGEEHASAERSLAAWVGVDACLLFTSGFAANTGTIGALVGEGDLVLSDQLNHASIIDGCRLSRSRVLVFPHRDLAAAERILVRERSHHRRALLVSESYFSMDGTLADLQGLRELADRHQAVLMVDEAHAIGVFGERGRGRLAAEGVRADVFVGTLGKALGLQGAFVGGAAELRLHLWNRARSFVFSTAMSPSIAQAVPRRVETVQAADDRRRSLMAAASLFRRVLHAEGASTVGDGPIVAWVVGSPDKALDVQRSLEELGVWVAAIRPPTVPEGTSRLRITPSAGLSPTQVEAAAAALTRVARSVQ